MARKVTPETELKRSVVRFTIPMEPVAKKRPRFFRKGSYVGTYKDSGEVTEEGRFLTLAHEHKPPEPLEGPLRMDLKFYRFIPKSFSKIRREKANMGLILPTQRPDLDNYIKFIKDCMNGVFYKDDSQIISIDAEKLYSEKPRVEVLIWKTS